MSEVREKERNDIVILQTMTRSWWSDCETWEKEGCGAN